MQYFEFVLFVKFSALPWQSIFIFIILIILL